MWRGTGHAFSFCAVPRQLPEYTLQQGVLNEFENVGVTCHAVSPSLAKLL